MVVVRDPELIKEIFVKNFDHFPDHENIIDEKLDPILGKNLISLRGERWKELRSTLSPSFTATKMKLMFQLVVKCSKNFVEYFLRHPEEADSLEAKDAFRRYATDVIATAAFGISVNSLENKENEFYLRGKDAAKVTIFRVLKGLVFMICPRIMKLIGEPLLPRKTDQFFRRVIRETLKEREDKNIIRPDMIHLLMEARDKENGIDLSIDDIIAQAFLFFFAGFDTTSTLMCFLAHELAVNPEIQEKLRTEVDSLMKEEGSEVSYEAISKMKYMNMVISETLRKYPPAQATDRLSVHKHIFPKPTPESNDYTAEPNSLYFIPIYGLHHDSKYFPEPKKFDPERFSDENKNNINPYAYLPFGLGPRKCIGDRFALMETKILFVKILQNFVLEKTEKTKDPLKFEKGLIMAIEGGFWVRLKKRISFY